MVGDGEHEESNHAEHDEHDAQQDSSNQEVGQPLLFGPRMGDAKGGDKCLGEPCEEFQWIIRCRPEYVIGQLAGGYGRSKWLRINKMAR